jgi:hypothetical protein
MQPPEVAFEQGAAARQNSKHQWLTELYPIGVIFANVVDFITERV